MQQTDLTELTGSTFLESLEANNKLIQKNDELDQNRNKIAKDEILKKVGEMFTSFQSFVLKAQRNTNQRTITNEPNYQQHIYTAPPQACPPYYLPSSFYSQSTMNQLHIFSASPEVNHPINFNSVIQTPNQEPPQEVNPANEWDLIEWIKSDQEEAFKWNQNNKIKIKGIYSTFNKIILQK